MGGIFTKKAARRPAPPPKAAISDRDKAVYDLKVQRDRLKKFIVKNDALVVRETEVARELVKAKQKEKAKLVLRKKRLHESMIEKSMAKMANIEELVNSIQFAEITAQVFAALKEGNEALQSINAQMDIDDVDKLMEDTAEAVAYQEQISEMLSGQMTAQDDEAALRELDMIEQEETEKLQKQFDDIPAVDRPAVSDLERVQEQEQAEEVQEREVELA
ncbi:Snf7 [Plasmodiophora brassicae]|nr:hypothetical protein PBRA_002518 [Plasmodiophora brassicae]